MRNTGQAQNGATKQPAATKSRNFRTFLLVTQLEAEAIGARLALARKEAGFTQEQVAEMSTMSKRSLQNYEAGITIPYAHFRELAAIYTREVDWFLHGEAAQKKAILLEELAASVVTLTEGVEDAIRRLARIEAMLERREAGSRAAS